MTLREFCVVGIAAFKDKITAALIDLGILETFVSAQVETPQREIYLRQLRELRSDVYKFDCEITSCEDTLATGDTMEQEGNTTSANFCYLHCGLALKGLIFEPLQERLSQIKADVENFYAA